MSRPRVSEIIEKGDVFFFYRPRVGVEHVHDLGHVQRLYMLLASTEHGRRRFRLLVIGGKRLPEVIPGKADPKERHWAMVVGTTTDPDDIREELSAKRYVTVTRGERVLAASKPVGEGRYWLLVHEDHTELAYVLDIPQSPGEAQKTFNIAEEASYIVAVRNPDMPAPPGMPTIPAPQQKPSYPRLLREAFDDKRWIPADDPNLLDYACAQLLLLGTHQGKAVEEELGITIRRRHETSKSAEVFTLLRLDRKAVPLEPLFKGKFPARELPPDVRPESLPAVEVPPTRHRRASPRR
jgi:hypothetical protein